MGFLGAAKPSRADCVQVTVCGVPGAERDGTEPTLSSMAPRVPGGALRCTHNTTNSEKALPAAPQLQLSQASGERTCRREHLSVSPSKINSGLLGSFHGELFDFLILEHIC